MSPKFYSYLWMAYALSAGVLWLGGAFTMVTLVVYGFAAFGLVFMGMMCVLPGEVSHNHEAAKMVRPTKKPKAVTAKPDRAHAGFSSYKSA